MKREGAPVLGNDTLSYGSSTPAAYPSPFLYMTNRIVVIHCCIHVWLPSHFLMIPSLRGKMGRMSTRVLRLRPKNIYREGTYEWSSKIRISTPEDSRDALLLASSSSSLPRFRFPRAGVQLNEPKRLKEKRKRGERDYFLVIPLYHRIFNHSLCVTSLVNS